MPLGELRSASGSGGVRGGGGGCSRCGRCCRKREVKALRCLCGLAFLGMFLLALPVLYLIRAQVVEKPQEIVTERMPAAQKQQGNPLYNNGDSTIRPSVHARVKSNVSWNKCVNGDPAGSSLLWAIVSEVGQFQLDEENIHFIIPKDGRYFVYSQVTFSCFGCDCEENRCCGMKTKGAKDVWQQIAYKTPAYSGHSAALLMSTSSINETTFLKSLYLAGVMPFKKGEKLLVNVSKPALVHPEIHYTFFGAYLIG